MRRRCWLCNLDLQYKNDKYYGIRIPRGRKKIQEMAQYLGMHLSSMNDFNENDEICHRHYEEFSFCEKGTKSIKKHLIVPENVLPNHANNIRNNVCRQNHPSGTVSQPSVFTTLPERSTGTAGPSSSELHENFEHDFDAMDTVESDEDDERIGEEVCEEKGSIPNFLIAEGVKLMELFQWCFSCGSFVSAKKNLSICGTAVIIKFYCNGCKQYKKWSSQSTIGDSKRYTGNVLIPSTAVLTPISHSSLLQFSNTLGMPMVKWTTFNYVQRNAFVVVAEEYNKMKESILEDVLKRQEEGEEVYVSADAQFDSRGYCAKQGWETIMCSRTKRVLTGHLLENTETNGNSSAMEVEGLRRGLLELHNRGIQVKILTTDRSKSVAKMVKNEFVTVKHLFDPWHYIKGLHKIFREATKLKTAPEMKAWLSPILNHIWHSVIHSNGDGKRCAEFIFVTLMHSLGVHQWQPGRLEDVLRHVHSKFSLTAAEKKKYKKNNPSNIKTSAVKDFQMSMTRCPHSPRLEGLEESGRLVVYSKVYNVILNTLTTEHAFMDMQQLSPHLSTANLENLHFLITGKYRSKNIYYPKKQSYDRLCLAYYHHNMNVVDEMQGRRRVVKKVQRKAKHKGGEYVWHKIKSPPDYSWKAKFNAIILDNYVNNNIIKRKAKHEQNEEEVEVGLEEAENEEGANYIVEVDEEFDEHLMEEIGAGRISSELLHLFEEQGSDV